ncbi:MAG TPA: SIMPL domain-containing protein [Burkholderiaceae bacterium]|nr:SIMPL domain-containing protein [Burkholderiaceae bacterium]
MNRLFYRGLMAVCVAAVSIAAPAQLLPAPQDVLTLSASSSVEVQYDVIAMTMSATREGSDASVVQSQLRQAVDAALSEARKAQRPGQIDVRTGAFSLTPRYGNRGAQITGWIGTGEVVLEGRDMAAIAQVAARLATMTVARVGYALSRETRERVEADAVSQAIARFRARAGDYAKQFGFNGYTVREVNVGTADPMLVQPMMRQRMVANAASDESIPVEAGKATLNVTVNGSVQMTR